MTFKEQSNLKTGFRVIMDRMGIDVLHTKRSITDSTTGYYSDSTITTGTTTWIRSVVSERNQRLMTEKYGEFKNGDVELSFYEDSNVAINDLIDLTNKQYEIRQVTDEYDGSGVYKDAWGRLVTE